MSTPKHPQGGSASTQDFTPGDAGDARADDPAATIRELKEQIAEYETLLRVVPIGISIARDPECKVIVSNRHHAALLGHTPDENTSIDPRAADPGSFRIFRDGVEIGVDELPMHRAIAEKREIVNVECDVITNAGERLTFVGHAAPLLDEDRNVRGAVGAFNDITERKLAEEKLADSERRHRQLASENAHLYEEAQAALRLRERFVATVSHELRSPLSAILGWTEIARDSRNEGRLATALENIERNARRQGRLIEDLLDASRVATGQLQIECRETDLVTVVNDAVQTLSAMAENAGVRLTSIVPTIPVVVHGDPDRLHQVVWNLVSNAIKFAPQGEICVETRRDGDDAVVRVTDTGCGISPDFLPHVFEQFRRAQGDTASGGQGLGLGLSIVRHIVELHGGRVHADSDGPGKGATFVVSLPMRVSGELSGQLDSRSRAI